uniref:Tetrapyrrole biosynthesis uroporphyrinogen III synthase domain-containing protein n=1 Tax=Thermosporothrix sp. COM3 TaxID=2490863 RepID=A0A455SI59_9CHLR|nr:hypothetical protein KTC_13430 [Thermosporothrix sp. COM3]
MVGFHEATVALLESRMSDEMANLIRRFGGTPYSVSSVRELPVQDEGQIEAFIRLLLDKEADIVIFSTGKSASLLLQAAEERGQLPALLEALRQMQVFCRGPKPYAVLKKHDVPVALQAPAPHTTETLLEAMKGLEMRSKRVALLHHGERNEALVRALREREAAVNELCLYVWQLPEDTGPLRKLVHELIAGDVHAIVFTSQVQVRHLLLIAQEEARENELIQALNERVIVGSVGPVCTAMLNQYGVRPHVVPDHPKMGHLVKALAQYMG